MEDDRKTIEEACDNVQIELGAFLTLMEKLELTRLAEERQATEYDLIQVRICASTQFYNSVSLLSRLMKVSITLSGRV